MPITSFFSDSTVARYARSMRTAPREVIFSPALLLSCALYAACGVPITWDQGSSSTVPSLPGFQQHFGVSSGANPELISDFVSLVYIGCGVGSGLSYFINDRIGRLWSVRLYMGVWVVGQLIATFAPNLPALYAARIISGLGIGPLTVVGGLAIVELAPSEVRGLLASWFSVAMLLSLFLASICVYGVFELAANRLQYQVVWFAPCVFVLLCVVASFFLCESPRWLFLVGRDDEARAVLVRLRRLPEHHPRVAAEVAEIRASRQPVACSGADTGLHQSTSTLGNGGREFAVPSFLSVLKETFTVSANLRRVQQVLVSYALAQLSGANSVTSYLVPILSIMGMGGDSHHSLFLSSMYSLAKFFFTLIASFFLIDALGRRRSLFLGISIQMISDIYIGIYIKFAQAGPVSTAASSAALAAIFLHGFGYAIGLLILPYVFGAEVWPNHLRSFGGSLGQMFHWLFYYGVNAAMPSILSSMDNWGAFLFFAAWCLVALIYVFLVVPELAGLSVEELDDIFSGPWFSAWRARPRRDPAIASSGVIVVSEGIPKGPSDGSRISQDGSNHQLKGGKSTLE